MAVARKSKKKQGEVVSATAVEGTEIQRIPTVEELVDALKEHTEIIEKGEWAPIAAHVLDLILAAVQEQIDGADPVKTCQVCAGIWKKKLSAVKGAATEAIEGVSEAALEAVAEKEAATAAKEAAAEATKVTAGLLVSLASDVEALQVGLVTLRQQVEGFVAVSRPVG